MPKLFNEILALRIKEVFNSHVEEYDPNDWKNMSAKLGKESKTKTIYLFPTIAKAASIILFIGLSVFSVNDIRYNPNKIQSFNSKNTQNNDTIAEPVFTDNKIKNNKTENQQTKDSYVNNNLTKVSPENLIIADSNRTFPQVENYSYIHTDSSKLALVNIKDVLKEHREKIQKMDSSNVINVLAPLDNGNVIAEETEKKQKNFEFGVEVASVSNYSSNAKGTNFNVGGGFTAGYRFSKNISMSTGLSIAKQSIEYESPNSTNFYEVNKSSYANTNSLNVIDANSAESNLSFVAIDIPINFEFSLQQFMISAGVSSLFFVNEKYSYSYNATVSNMVYDASTSRFQTENTSQNISTEEQSEAFNHFDFARLLNFSVAYKLPMQKGSMAFEPYVKIPLASISSKDVKMGSGGVTLRYNF